MQFARHLLEYLAARTLVAILALLPRPFATRIAMGGSCLLFACLPRLRHIGLRNLELAFPDLSLDERRQLLEQSLENFGRIIADFAHFPHATPADLAARVGTSFPKNWKPAIMRPRLPVAAPSLSRHISATFCLIATLRASAAASAIVPSTSAIQSWKVSPFSTPAATSAFLPM